MDNKKRKVREKYENMQRSLHDLSESAKEATKALSIFSLLVSGIKVEAEDIDILNAEIIE